MPGEGGGRLGEWLRSVGIRSDLFTAAVLGVVLGIGASEALRRTFPPRETVAANTAAVEIARDSIQRNAAAIDSLRADMQVIARITLIDGRLSRIEREMCLLRLQLTGRGDDAQARRECL